MEPRNMIMRMFLLVLVVLAMSAGVQAQDLREVPASEILEHIQAGEDVNLENVRITGEFNVSKIELETVPVARREWKIVAFGLEKELKIVESEITIMNSVFENDVDLSNTQFRKTLNFRNSSFLGISDFGGASFGSGAYFWFVSFSGDAYFRSASFGGDAEFWSARFGGGAYFRSARFGGGAYFRSARFDGDANFEYVCFDGDTDFGSVIFGGDVIFNYAEFNKVFFYWPSLKNALVFDGPIYAKLIKNFREMEQFKDADDTYYQYRRLSQVNKKWSFSKLGDMFMWLSCGYGVKPQYTIILAMVLILIFTSIYWLGNGIRRLKENDEDDKQDVSFCDAFYFSVITFTTVGYGDWYPKDRYRKFVMIEGLVGWLILALFLVTLANVMIRP